MQNFPKILKNKIKFKAITDSLRIFWSKSVKNCAVFHIFGLILFLKSLMSDPLKMGFFQFIHRSSLIWLNLSFAPEIKVRSRVMSERDIWKSNLPSSGMYISNFKGEPDVRRVEFLQFFQLFYRDEGILGDNKGTIKRRKSRTHVGWKRGKIDLTESYSNFLFIGNLPIGSNWQ